METEQVTLIGAVALVLGVGVGFGLGRSTPSAEAPTQNSELVNVDITGRPYRGADNAPVTLVEFTDYECPYCKRHFQLTLDTLLALYGNKLKYVIRNFPVTSLHAHAQEAAEAAECALDQGKFWEYHDLLFRRSPALRTDSLKAYAAEVGLDVTAFTTCLDPRQKRSVVARDVKDGRHYGVSGTPTFFINGRILIGAQPVDAFRAYIDATGAASSSP
jgi:protein-disulfide isomerase